MALNLKIGQLWRTRSGGSVTLTDFNDSCNPARPWASNCGTYTARGTVFLGGEDPRDLIELISEAPATPAPEPDDAAHQAVEILTDLGWVFTDGVWAQETPQGYDKLADVLARALAQASQGKGKERHATGDTPFEEQPMATINRQLGSVHGFIYQAHKKSLEAMRLPAGRDVAELLGAINYLAGAVIALESWAKKGG